MSIEIRPKIHNPRFDHFTKQVIAFTGTFTHTREHGNTTVPLGNVVDQLLHDHGLAYTRTAEQTNLTTLENRLNQVENLDAGFKHLRINSQIFKFRR
ncbi:hypothetical protein BMS3Bbin04_00191 [bacterium BMS3Bbin04]|nr:hypothetical protein BMS3Bbin04_00191 [bacterium BMS3Bbin04]